jgi:hypothetical protein
MTTALQHGQAAHSLARVGNSAEDLSLIDVARRHMEAVLAQRTPCGLFSDPVWPVSTSVLARITHSLMVSSRLLGDERPRLAPLRATQGIRGYLCSDGWLAGGFDDRWMPAGSHVCVTGLARLAGCWLHLAPMSQDDGWRGAAWCASAWITRDQRSVRSDLGLRDALPSAVPIWGGPAEFSFEALNAKHFSDALRMDIVGIKISPTAETGQCA